MSTTMIFACIRVWGFSVLRGCVKSLRYVTTWGWSPESDYWGKTDLAVLEVAEAAEEVSDDAVARDHGVREDNVLVVLRLSVCECVSERECESVSVWV